jgi:hypothetical protein
MRLLRLESLCADCLFYLFLKLVKTLGNTFFLA